MRIRAATLADVAMREHEDGLPGFTGHAAVFNQPTLIGSKRFGFIEQIAPGAFADVLDDDVRFLFNHGGEPMARTVNGTLRLGQDTTGLTVEADFANTQLSRDQVELLDRGDLSEMSFAFNIGTETRSTYEGDVSEWEGMPLLTIDVVARLFDVSTVAYPAYGGTDASIARTVSGDDIDRRLTDSQPPVQIARPVLSSPRGLPPRRWALS